MRAYGHPRRTSPPEVESLETERAALALYRELRGLVEGRSVALEEFAREMIAAEEMHAGDVEKMLRKPGDTVPGRAPAKPKPT